MYKANLPSVYLSQPNFSPYPQTLLQIHRQGAIRRRRRILNQRNQQRRAGKGHLIITNNPIIRLPHPPHVRPRLPRIQHPEDGCGELSLEDHAVEHEADDFLEGQGVGPDALGFEPEEGVLGYEFGVPFGALEGFHHALVAAGLVELHFITHFFFFI